MTELAPKKSVLKLKPVVKPVSKQKINPIKLQAQMRIQKAAKQQQKQKQKEKQREKLQNGQNQQQQDEQQVDGHKTQAERAHTLIKKKRLIHKIDKKLEVDHRTKIQKFKRNLSKQPDHYDLAKIGEKIQKGY